MIGSHTKKYLRLVSYLFTSVAMIFVSFYILKNVKHKTAEYTTAAPSLINIALADTPHTAISEDSDPGDDCDAAL